MDTKALLDQLLGAGKQLVEQSRDFAEKKMGLPESGPERDAKLKTFGTGAAVGGLAALLLGTESGLSAALRLPPPLVSQLNAAIHG